MGSLPKHFQLELSALALARPLVLLLVRSASPGPLFGTAFLLELLVLALTLLPLAAGLPEPVETLSMRLHCLQGRGPCELCSQPVQEIQMIH